MRVWRLCAPRHADAALSGEGARLYGGRWNPVGVPVVYCASTLSLAALELLVHAEPGTLEAPFTAVEVDVPDGIPRDRVSPDSLPRGGSEYPAPLVLAEIGARWIGEGRSAVLEVPSAVVPEEFNVLLAPSHPALRTVRVVRHRTFVFDPRLQAAPAAKSPRRRTGART